MISAWRRLEPVRRRPLRTRSRTAQEMIKCLKGAPHPCERVVLDQWPADVTESKRLYRWPFQHLLPEPWTGHLEQAPLLFLASNPGGGEVAELEPPFPPPANALAGELDVKNEIEHPSLRPPYSGPVEPK